MNSLLCAGIIVMALIGTGNVAQAHAGDTSSCNGAPTPSLNPAQEALRALAPLFLPKVMYDCWQLKSFIQGEDFQDLRASHGDIKAVDAIYARAKRLSWDNMYESLLISFVATMDHREFGIEIPLLGPLLWIPLTSEFHDEFEARVACLPRNLYPDGPHDRSGDRDKLQHFFGAAFLTYVFESPGAADRTGNFVERGEQLFVVGGVNDPRDVRANRQGERFGAGLLKDPSLVPSGFIGRLEASPPDSLTDPGAPDSLASQKEVR